MADRVNAGTIRSDESLVLRARSGDRGAFAELWQRHARSGLRVARQFTSSIEADDLVSEAFARIYQRVLAGGGPDGAFRPYLYTTIRNLASRWGQERRDVNVDDIGDWEDPSAESDPIAVALDRTLTVRAFRTLPERWQTVLWYTEVEGLDPHEVAPMLGISANGVAALSYRAREGLRKAWLQAHVSDATASGDCQWAIARLGDYARNGLTARERTRVTGHLATCARCSIIGEEVDEVGSRLALVMLPLLLGGVVGGAFLASLGAPASVAAALTAPALPPAFGALGSAGAVAAPAVAAPTVAAGLSVTAITGPLIGTIAVAMLVSGGVAASHAQPSTAAPHSRSVVQSLDRGSSGSSGAPDAPAAGVAVDDAIDAAAPISRTRGAVASALSGAVTGLATLVTDVENPVNGLLPRVAGAAVVSSAAITAPAAPGLSGAGVPGALTGLGSGLGAALGTGRGPVGPGLEILVP